MPWLLAAPLLPLLLPWVARAAADSPVQKVISLMNGMVEKGKKEKHEEKMQFAAYKQFCESTIAEKGRAIKEATEEVDALTANIQKYEADAAELDKGVAKLDADISTWESELKASAKVREIEKADYAATFKDYGDSIVAVEDGIKVLGNENHATKQASALIQVSSLSLLSAEERRVINTYLSQVPADENLAAAAPEANAYEFQSSGIVDMLEGLKEKFEDERSDLEKKEINAQNAYELTTKDLKSQVDEGTSDKLEKSAEKSGKVQAAAEAKSDLELTSATKDDDSKYTSELKATCEAKAAAFEERQKLRAEEIAAIEKAIEIMSSGAVAGNSEKHLPSLLQVGSRKQGGAFAQLRVATSSPRQLRVAAFLKDRAASLHSRILSVLSLRVSADPFKKVKKMIKDLITKLMEEANEEAEHKGWCDTEMSTNEQTRKQKAMDVEELTAETDELSASISRLTTEITELNKAVVDLDAAVAKATGIRQAEKAKNEQTIKDAQDAQEAVSQALAVLRDFYEKAGDATALAQTGQQQEPEVFGDEPYQGMGGASGGVIGMVEVIQSDFARLETETTAGEEQGQKEYDEFMGTSATDKAAKVADIDSKTSKKQSQEQKLTETQGDLAGVQKELGAALEYFEKLKPSCVDAGESFEDRVARRKEEIESMQEALKVLSGDDIA